MQTVTVDEAKAQLEDLIARAARGELVAIVDPVHGTAMLTVAERGHRVPRVPGSMKGKLPTLPDEFFAPLGEADLEGWYGNLP